MAKEASTFGTPHCNTVFIDTNLGTGLITTVSSSETVSDLKKRVLHEHVLCFPRVGDIEIHGLMVKRRGKFYNLSESILVKSVFDGVTKNWFITVDASNGSRILSEERAAKTRYAKKKKRPRKRKGNHVVDKFASKEDNAIHGPTTTIVQSCSERTRELKKHVELNNAKSMEISVDVLWDQSLEDDPKSEPKAKRRRKIKQAKKGAGTLVSTVSQKSPVDRYATLDGAPDQAVHSKTFAAVPCAIKNVELNNAKSMVLWDQSLEDNPKSEPKAKRRHKIKQAKKDDGTLVSTISQKSPVDRYDTLDQAVHSKTFAKDKQGDPAQEINSRHSSLEISTVSKEAGNVEGGHEASGSHLECGKDITAENDRCIQSAQVVAQKLESISKKRCCEAIISGSPSRSGRANEVTHDVEVSCQSNGVDINNLETAGSSEMLVGEVTKTNGADGMVKAKKGRKKHDAYSDGANGMVKAKKRRKKKKHEKREAYVDGLKSRKSRKTSGGCDLNIEMSSQDSNDELCWICVDGGELICCDTCPSTFHLTCLGITDLPEGPWHCIYCFCKICHKIMSGDDRNTCCYCRKKYHPSCAAAADGFCGDECQDLQQKLDRLIGVKHKLEGGYSWSFVRRKFDDDDDDDDDDDEDESDDGMRSKLRVALEIMEKCFKPMVENRSGINLIGNMVYNRSSNLERLDYSSFFTAILENGDDEIVSAATVRIHGNELAEMPYAATREMYRSQGMCRRLLRGIESGLRSLNVEKLVIPSIPKTTHFWISKIGFKRVFEPESKRLLENYNMVVCPDVDILYKPLNLNHHSDSPNQISLSTESSL